MMTVEKPEAEPASFVNIAFDSGRIYERVEILKMLETSLADCGVSNCDRCDQREGLKAAIKLIEVERE